MSNSLGADVGPPGLRDLGTEGGKLGGSGGPPPLGASGGISMTKKCERRVQVSSGQPENLKQTPGPDCHDNKTADHKSNLCLASAASGLGDYPKDQSAIR